MTMDVRVQVPAYQEPDLASTLDVIAEQHSPEWADVKCEAWVTPSEPALEDCQTWRQADAHDTFRARVAPQGKLSARNVAHEEAVQEGADAVVTIDADAPPLTADTIEKVIAPLRSDNVVGTMATPVNPPTLGAKALEMATKAVWSVSPYMHGQCSAVSADGWRYAGPFKEHINQTSITRVWLEEERRFYKRLTRKGHVVKVPDAKVRNDMRRWDCKLSEPFDPTGADSYCGRRGVDTFRPDDRR